MFTLSQIPTLPLAIAPSAYRSFSVLNRPPPNYPGHVPLNMVERGALAVGSALGSLFNPRRAGKVMNEPFFLQQSH